METQSMVRVYNEVLGLKGGKGKFIETSSLGYYDIILEINGKNYTAHLPIATTVVIANEAEPSIAEKIEVER